LNLDTRPARLNRPPVWSRTRSGRCRPSPRAGTDHSRRAVCWPGPAGGGFARRPAQGAGRRRRDRKQRLDRRWRSWS